MVVIMWERPAKRMGQWLRVHTPPGAPTRGDSRIRGRQDLILPELPGAQGSPTPVPEAEEHVSRARPFTKQKRRRWHARRSGPMTWPWARRRAVGGGAGAAIQQADLFARAGANSGGRGHQGARIRSADTALEAGVHESIPAESLQRGSCGGGG